MLAIINLLIGNMELLCKNNLFLKPEKCEFEKTEVEYLGVIISQNSFKMDPVKVAGVTEWPIPSNRKEVQSLIKVALGISLSLVFWTMDQGLQLVVSHTTELGQITWTS